MTKDNESATASALSSTYWHTTRQANACLVFLIPLVAAYEIGALILRPGGHTAQTLVAPNLIQQFIAWLGADAVWVPGAALIVTLVFWRVFSKRLAKLRADVLLLMIGECMVLTLPLFVLGALLQQSLAETRSQLLGQLVLALGAGIYEELVFRFYLLGGLAWLLAEAFRLRRFTATCTAALVATLAFAACHLAPIGAEPFAWPRFLMLAVAGGYLAVVFLFRGLAVATGAHAAYNMLALLLSNPQPE